MGDQDGEGRTPASGADADRHRSPALRANRDFRIFVGGQGISALGDAVSFTALPLLVILLTGSGVALGVVGVLTTLPDLIFGLPAGALADRWDRRKMMIVADLGRAALTAFIPLSFAFGFDAVVVILIVTAPINLLRVAFMAAFTAVVPSLVERDQIGRANGVVEALLSLSFVIGPAIAGALVGTIGPGPTLAIDAASFLFSAGAMVLIRRPLRAERDPDAPPTHIVADIAEGVRYILSERVLRAAIAFWGATSVATAPLVPAVIFYLTIDRDRPEGIVGLVLSGYGVGYFLGALIAGRFARGRLGRTMLIGNVATALALAGFVLSDSTVLEAVFAAAAGVSGALTLISYVTLRATIPPNELLGRVGSTARTISLGLQPIGVFIGGVLLDIIGGGPTILLSAAAIIAVTGIATLSPAVRGAVAGTGGRAA